MKNTIIYLTLIINLLYPFSQIIGQEQQVQLDSLEKNVSDFSEKEQDSIYNLLAKGYLKESNQKSEKFANTALQIARQTNDKTEESKALKTLGLVYVYRGDKESALEYWLKELKLNEEMNDQKAVSTSLVNIGILYKNWAKYEKAINYYQRALKIQEKSNDQDGKGLSYANIGNLYWYIGNTDKAIDYYKQAIDIFEILDNKTQQARIYNNLGLIRVDDRKFDEAIEHFNKGLQLYEELDNKQGIAMTLTNIGSFYLEKKNYQKALENCYKSLEIMKEIGISERIPYSLVQIGEIYLEWGKYAQALDYYMQSLEMFKKGNLKKEMYDNYRDISKAYRNLGNYKKALEYYQKYANLKDSTFTEQMHKQITEMQTKYETEKKEQEIKLLNKDKALQKTRIKQQRILIYVFIGVFIIVIIFSLLLFKQIQETKKANRKLEHQNEEISKQRDLIFEQKQAITDSILYARRIQTAVLPPAEYMDTLLNDYFILYKPKDIVSGDFYWLTHKDNKTIVVAADCTGHGVPGAFMSMLGVSFLNEIVNKNDVLQANIILDLLRQEVIKSLRQTGKEGESKDGMDIALSIIDLENMEVDFAGAYNPLYLIRNNELHQYKASKMPIGIHYAGLKPFKNTNVNIEKGDCLYTFSDGFVDQFGGEDGKKYMSKNFKRLLVKIHQKPMAEQKEILDNEIKQWIGEDYEQIDDILVIGIRI